MGYAGMGSSLAFAAKHRSAVVWIETGRKKVMPHHGGLAERVERLEDVDEIHALKARYAVGIDTVHRTPSPAAAQAFADLYTDDGVLDLGAFGRYEGKSTILAAATTIFPAATIWSMHYMINPQIAVDGSQATGRWYFLLYTQPAGTAGSPPISVFGEYMEKYEKTAEGWKFKEVLGILAPPK